MGVAHTSAVPPAASGWPPDRENTPPCPHCGTPMHDVPQFQVNLHGPRQIAEGQPPVEVADVVCVCPTCRIQSVRRYQAPPDANL